MKKLLLSFTILLTSLISFAQYGGCQFTLGKDSSCITVGDFDNSLDTITMMRGNRADNSPTSNFKIKANHFFIFPTQFSTILSKGNLLFEDTTTAEIHSTSIKYLTLLYSQITGLATVAHTGDYNDLSNKPSTGAVSNISSVASGTRNFNQAYQVSTTKYTDVRLSTQISCNLSLSGGQSGQIFLEYSSNGTTGWTFGGEITGSSTGTLTIGLNTTQISGNQISVILPPSYYWRLRTNNVTGTPTYAFLGGLEITY